MRPAKKLMNALEEISNERMERFLEIAQELFLIADPEGSFKFLNHSWEKTLGYNLETLYGMNFRDLVSGEAGLSRSFPSQWSKGGISPFKQRFTAADGSMRWLSGKIHFDEGSSLVFLAAHDITDFQINMDRLEEIEEQIAFKNEQLPLGYIECDLKKEILKWNSCSGSTFGFTEEKTSSQTVLHLFVESARTQFLEIWSKIARTGKPESAVFDCYASDGRIITGEFKFVPVLSKNSIDYVELFFQDITARLKASEELKKYRDDTQKIVDTRSREVQAINEQLMREVTERIKVEKELRTSRALLDRELNMAATIQKGITAGNLDPWNGFSFASLYRPMEKVSGDYIDIFREFGCLFLLCVDVSGHGIPAALITMAAKQAFSSLARGEYSPARIFRSVNKSLIQKVTTDDYLTAILVKIDDRNHLTFSCAGHPPALLYRKKGNEFISLDTEGSFIAAFPDERVTYEDREIKLQSGDIVVLYTDGILEHKNNENEEFGLERWKQVIRESPALSDLPGRCVAALSEFSGGRSLKDDVSMLAFELSPLWDEFSRFFNRAIECLKNQNLKQADIELTAAAKLFPGYPRLKYIQARYHYLNRDYARADEILQPYILAHKKDMSALKLAYNNLLNLGRQKEVGELKKRILNQTGGGFS